MDREILLAARLLFVCLLFCSVSCRRDNENGEARQRSQTSSADDYRSTQAKHESSAGQSEDLPRKSSSETGADDDVRGELELLRSLGYVDHTPEAARERDRGVTIFDQSRSYPGYNLYTIRPLCRTELVDSRGRLVHFWEDTGGGRWVRSHLLDNGDLLVVGADLPVRYLLRISWDNKVLWRRNLPAHHAVRTAPDGRFVTLTLKKLDLPDVRKDGPVRVDSIALFSAKSDQVEEYSLYEMLAARPDVFTVENFERTGGIVDLIHANSVRWIGEGRLAQRDSIIEPDHVLVSMRNQNAIAIFDLKKREVVWAWGPGELQAPHGATVLDNGNILVFDNGTKREWSRVIELDPLSKDIVWSYSAPEPGSFFTSARGGAQRLGNGNTLITESNDGRAFEVTPDGEIVWEYFVPHVDDRGRRTVIIRLYRYERDLIDRLIKQHRPSG